VSGRALSHRDPITHLAHRVGSDHRRFRRPAGDPEAPPMTNGSAAPSLASDYLLRTDERAVRVITLAGLVAPAVVIEPELIREMRIHVEPRFDTGVEADLWFSPLVQDRGPAGITLTWEVVPTLLDRLRVRVRAAGPDDLVRRVEIGR